MNEMKNDENIIQDAVDEPLIQSHENSNSAEVPFDEVSPLNSIVENFQHNVVSSEMTPTAGQAESSNELAANQVDHVESMNSTVTGKSYKDFSGIDTESFIVTTLRDHPKDRPFILSLEKFFREFIGDDQRTVHQFQPMNSYERMIVHRVAAYFGLDHNVDRSGYAIFVTKVADTRIPDLSFKNLIPVNDSMNGAFTSPALTTKISSNHLQENHTNSNTNISSSLSSNTNQLQEKATRPMMTRVQRKQPRTMTKTERPLVNHHTQSPSHSSTDQSRMYSPMMLSASPHQQKLNNYTPLVAYNPSSLHSNMSLAPILVQQASNGSIQYGYAGPPPAQIAIPAAAPQYTQVPPPNFITFPPVYQSSTQFVHMYPNSLMNPYFHTVSTNSITPVDYATQQMAMLNLQMMNGHSTRFPSNQPIHYLGRSLVQSPTNGVSVPMMYSHPNLPDKSKFVNAIESKSTISNHKVDVLPPTK